MNPISKLIKYLSNRARKKRAVIFRNYFELTPETRIIDIGSEDGSNISSILEGCNINPENVYIADISEDIVKNGHSTYGFTPVVLSETGVVPFEDNFFDIVYCSSVIEHVTLPKSEIWECTSGKEFRRRCSQRQGEFAIELRRLGKKYFVQTPNKWFPIESHTWLPFIGWLPRKLAVTSIRITNHFWIKKTTPDWNLLTVSDMKKHFPEAAIKVERFGGLIKSIMAISR